MESIVQSTSWNFGFTCHLYSSGLCEELNYLSCSCHFAWGDKWFTKEWKKEKTWFTIYKLFYSQAFLDGVRFAFFKACSEGGGGVFTTIDCLVKNQLKTLHRLLSKGFIPQSLRKHVRNIRKRTENLRFWALVAFWPCAGWLVVFQAELFLMNEEQKTKAAWLAPTENKGFHPQKTCFEVLKPSSGDPNTF